MLNNYIEEKILTTEKKYLKLSGCRYISKEEYEKIMQPTDLMSIHITNYSWVKKKEQFYEYVVQLVATVVAFLFIVMALPNIVVYTMDRHIYYTCYDNVSDCITEMKYEEALAILEDISHIKERDVSELIMLKANIYAYMDRFDEACLTLEEANASDPRIEYTSLLEQVKKSKAIYEYNALMQSTLDKEVCVSDDDRLSIYTKAIDAKPDEYKPYLLVADIYIERAQYDRAINIVQSGIDVTKKQLGKVQTKSYIELTSKLSYIESLINTKEYVAAYNMTKEAYKAGDIATVAIKFEEAKNYNTRDYKLYSVVAKAYVKDNKYNEALLVVNEGITALSVYKFNSSKVEGYKNLVDLKKKIETIRAYVGSYSKYFKKLYNMSGKLLNAKSLTGIEKMLNSKEYAMMATCNNVTYYNSMGKFVDNMSTGIGMAVYKNQYLYYGNWKNGLRHGVGCYVASYKKEGKIYTYLYKGKWSKGMPSGKGTVTYTIKKNNKIIYKTVTEGSYKKGYEDGKMTMTKYDKNSHGGKTRTLKYTAKKGVLQYLKDNKGKVSKTSSGDKIIGYYYIGKEKKEVVATKKKLVWKVQGLTNK